MPMTQLHQYIERKTGRVRTEQLTADPVIRTIYSVIRENAGFAFNLLVSPRMSSLVAALSYDFPFRRPRVRDLQEFLAAYGIDLTEVAEDPAMLDSWRRVFERKIRYEALRPMQGADGTVVSPADARMLLGRLGEGTDLFIKEKFFRFEELIGPDRPQWCRIFDGGDVAIFRLTPEKYHYNHTPVAGRVLDIYEISGRYHSCNPGAVVREVTPFSKNRRVVTILDTDVPGGTGVGRVAMVEVAAMMIGDIVQCYSRQGYESPSQVTCGMFLEKGRPKSLFRPGSSTTILMFEKDRIRFWPDIVENQQRCDVASRFSKGFGQPLVETEVRVRESVAGKI